METAYVVFCYGCNECGERNDGPVFVTTDLDLAVHRMVSEAGTQSRRLDGPTEGPPPGGALDGAWSPDGGGVFIRELKVSR